MDKIVLHRLNIKYSSENLDFLKALRAWNDLGLTPDLIKNQIQDDIGVAVTTNDSEEIYHLGAALQNDYTSISKDYEVSKGREDLIPDNIKNKKVKLSPAIRMSMERLGQNLYRDKKARTYWTLKEKAADNGEKVVYLVSVEEPDDLKKIAELKGTSEGTPTGHTDGQTGSPHPSGPQTGVNEPTVPQDKEQWPNELSSDENY